MAAQKWFHIELDKLLDKHPLTRIIDEKELVQNAGMSRADLHRVLRGDVRETDRLYDAANVMFDDKLKKMGFVCPNPIKPNIKKTKNRYLVDAREVHAANLHVAALHRAQGKTREQAIEDFRQYVLEENPSEMVIAPLLPNIKKMEDL